MLSNKFKIFNTIIEWYIPISWGLIWSFVLTIFRLERSFGFSAESISLDLSEMPARTCTLEYWLEEWKHVHTTKLQAKSCKQKAQLQAKSTTHLPYLSSCFACLWLCIKTVHILKSSSAFHLGGFPQAVYKDPSYSETTMCILAQGVSSGCV